MLINLRPAVRFAVSKQRVSTPGTRRRAKGAGLYPPVRGFSERLFVGPKNDSGRLQSGRGSLGFSLIEALLALTILSLVVVSFLGFLTGINDIVRVQGDITESSEDLRYSMALIVKQIRMAGAGGLPLVAPRLDGGFRPLAVDIVDSVTSGQELVSSIGGESWAFVAGRSPVEGTDVLRIRGVMASANLGVAAVNFEGRGRCCVPSISPWTGLEQKLAVPGRSQGRPYLFALQAPLTIVDSNGHSRDIAQWRVVEISDEVEVEDSGGGRRMCLKFDDSPSGHFGSLNAAQAFEVKATEVFSGGFLDDSVYLVSKNSFGGTSLYRLRITDGDGGRVAAEEMVPNVVDFQVALGCDLDADGRVTDEEWYLSRDLPNGPTADQMVSLKQMRVSIVTRTQNRDQKWSRQPEPLENGPRPQFTGQGYRFRSMTVRIKPRIADSGSNPLM